MLQHPKKLLCGADALWLAASSPIMCRHFLLLGLLATASILEAAASSPILLSIRTGVVRCIKQQLVTRSQQPLPTPFIPARSLWL